MVGLEAFAAQLEPPVAADAGRAGVAGWLEPTGCWDGDDGAEDGVEPAAGAPDVAVPAWGGV